MAKWEHLPIGQGAGAPPAAGDPFGFAWEKDDTQHVVYRGQDSQIHELWFRHGGLLGSKSTWGHNPIGSAAGAPQAASDPMGYPWEKDKTQHVIYIGTDGDIHELWCRSGKWAHNPIGKLTRAPDAVGNPFGFAWERDETQHVLYRGKDSAIHELWYRDELLKKVDWHHNPIGQLANAPAAAGDPSAYAWEKDKTQHIVYVGQDGMIQELWYRDKWGHNPVGQITGAPPAAGTPYGYAWEKDGTQHIVYRGKDGQIHELWFRHEMLQKVDWHHNPIGQLTGAPPAAGDPGGFAWERDDTQHVIYTGTDGMIHELWCRDGKWAHNPIGQVASAPQAIGKPSGYAWEGDKTQHVIYRGKDGQIHEIWMKK